MNIPSIPTDNLYKFCAIAGVVLVLFGATFPVQKIFEAQNDVDQTRTESNVLTQRIKNLREDVQRLSVNVEALAKDTNEASAHPRTADLSSLNARSSSSQADLSVVRDKNRELAIVRIKLAGKIEHELHVIQRLWLYVGAAVVFMFGGLALARFGFVRWYYRVQRPADELMARRIEGKGS